MTMQNAGIYTNEDLEGNFDCIKAVVLKALAKEGVIEYEVAEEWSKTHTIIIRKKSFFRTVTNLWREEKEFDESSVILCVELVKEKEDEND